MLKDDFINSCTKYTDQNSAQNLWGNITEKYSGKKRHYHNLSHLEFMYGELERCKNEIGGNWATVVFALVYHDIIYNATAKDNEERSATYAETVLKAMQYHEDQINFCSAIIMATKSHTHSDIETINLFTDADLAILGSSWADYEVYYKNIRREYDIYPDFMYNPGRKKVLKHFLEMKNIFKTNFFRNKYEKAARDNLKAELRMI